jgi:hypothetical protein
MFMTRSAQRELAIASFAPMARACLDATFAATAGTHTHQAVFATPSSLLAA